MDSALDQVTAGRQPPFVNRRTRGAEDTGFGQEPEHTRRHLVGEPECQASERSAFRTLRDRFPDPALAFSDSLPR